MSLYEQRMNRSLYKNMTAPQTSRQAKYRDVIALAHAAPPEPPRRVLFFRVPESSPPLLPAAYQAPCNDESRGRVANL